MSKLLPKTRGKNLFGGLTARFEYRLKKMGIFTLRTPGKRVFYPGCSLSAADPELVLRILEHLRLKDPSIGIWHDCCGEPLARFAGAVHSQKDLVRHKEFIDKQDVREIITACGNCAVRLKKMGLSNCTIHSLYDSIDTSVLKSQSALPHYVVHHPCPARSDKTLADSFWKLLKRAGIDTADTPDSSHHLACCLVNTQSARARIDKVSRMQTTLLTYCAHCTKAFGRYLPVQHVLQLLFDRPAAMKPQSFFSRFVAYLRLRRLLRNNVSSESRM